MFVKPLNAHPLVADVVIVITKLVEFCFALAEAGENLRHSFVGFLIEDCVIDVSHCFISLSLLMV
jgi:hypothetical protein